MADSYTIGGKWLEDLTAEITGSDRACAVLAGAVLDDRIKSLLFSYLLPPMNEKEDRLLGRSGTIESFSSRIELAYRSALISIEVRRALDWVRDIRNYAAHEQGFMFENDQIKDRVANIIGALQNIEKLPLKTLADHYGDTSKGKFVASVVILSFVLEFEARESGRTRHQPNLLRELKE